MSILARQRAGWTQERATLDDVVRLEDGRVGQGNRVSSITTRWRLGLLQVS
jgi:hypothetical protein